MRKFVADIMKHREKWDAGGWAKLSEERRCREHPVPICNESWVARSADDAPEPEQMNREFTQAELAKLQRQMPTRRGSYL